MELETEPEIYNCTNTEFNKIVALGFFLLIFVACLFLKCLVSHSSIACIGFTIVFGSPLLFFGTMMILVPPRMYEIQVYHDFFLRTDHHLFLGEKRHRIEFEKILTVSFQKTYYHLFRKNPLQFVIVYSSKTKKRTVTFLYSTHNEAVFREICLRVYQEINDKSRLNQISLNFWTRILFNKSKDEFEAWLQR